MTTHLNQKKVISLRKASDALGVSREFMDAAVAAGAIEPQRTANSSYISYAELARLDRNRATIRAKLGRS